MKNFTKTIFAACIILFILSIPSRLAAQEPEKSPAGQFKASKSEIFLGASVMVFNLGEFELFMAGFKAAYTWKFARKWGLILDAGYHADTYFSRVESDRAFQLTAGINYQTSFFGSQKLSLDIHALAGIIHYRSIYKLNYEIAKYRYTDLNTILGMGLNYRASNRLGVRLCQIELAATSYTGGQDGLANFMISTGVTVNLLQR